MTRAVGVLLEGKPLWGGPCQKVNIEEVDLRSSGAKGSEQNPNDQDAWEREIRRAGVGGALVFSDGSLLEGGVVGGGAFVMRTGNQGITEKEVEYEIGDVATVWDGEVAGMAGGLAEVKAERKILILVDSKAAIVAVRKAGRVGRAKSRHLQEVVNTIAEVKEGGGEVELGWVKVHIGISGNEAADVAAKKTAEGVRARENHEKWSVDVRGGHPPVGKTKEEGISGGRQTRGRGSHQ